MFLKWKRALPVLIIALIATGLVAGSYFLVARFLSDRQKIISHVSSRNGGFTRGREATRQTRTYTREEIEKARREKKPLPGMNNPSVPQAPINPGDDAVQRSLRTLDEINRINQMNQRLMDQQQRMNRQH